MLDSFLIKLQALRPITLLKVNRKEFKTSKEHIN